jgi:hypothetical protein
MNPPSGVRERGWPDRLGATTQPSHVTAGIADLVSTSNTSIDSARAVTDDEQLGRGPAGRHVDAGVVNAAPRARRAGQSG